MSIEQALIECREQFARVQRDLEQARRIKDECLFLVQHYVEQHEADQSLIRALKTANEEQAEALGVLEIAPMHVIALTAGATRH